MNSWNGHQRPPARTRVRTGVVAHRQHARAGTPSARAQLGAAPRSAARPRPAAARALQAHGEVAVAEVEPDVVAELAQPVHDVERVVAQAPAALVDAVGEPERDEVGVGRDVGAVDLDVVGRCWR